MRALIYRYPGQFLMVACLGMLSHTARATSVPRLSFDQLVAESDAVVTGVIVHTWTEWDLSHKMVWTRSEVSVGQSHKGLREKTLIINEPGGEIDGVGISIAGSVRYNAGDQVLVFLKAYPGLGFRTHGWGQGKYLVDAHGRLHADSSLGAKETTGLDTGDKQQASIRAFATNKLDGLTLLEAQSQIAARVRRGAAK